MVAQPYGVAMTKDSNDTPPPAAPDEKSDGSNWAKPALIGIGGAVASAAIAAAVIYAGRSKKKKPVDKLAAAEKTPPTD